MTRVPHHVVCVGLAALVLAACGEPPPLAAQAPAQPQPQPQPQAEPPAEPQASSLSVEGSAFVLKTLDGRVLRGTELAGATVYLAMPGGDDVAPIKLASIAPDPERPDILRHDFQKPDGKGGWEPACTPNAYGERWGFPVSLPLGHPGREGEITISCASGAVVKCSRWGYPVWAKGPMGEDLAPLHAACVRMVRADYCGDSEAHTKDGTSIDNYDDLGIQKRGAADDASYVFEAGWTPQGAVCVAHTRWADLLTMDALKASCPRLGLVPVCNEDTARAAGARMFNTSKLLPAK